jgi:hypothetical protein
MERAIGIELHPKFLSLTEQGVTCRSGGNFCQTTKPAGFNLSGKKTNRAVTAIRDKIRFAC